MYLEKKQHIDIKHLKKYLINSINQTFVSYFWTSEGVKTGEIGIHVFKHQGANFIRLSYFIKSIENKIINTVIQITVTRCNFGGNRYWFICPVQECKRRCTKLYWTSELFVCRKCSNTLYYLQVISKRTRVLFYSDLEVTAEQYSKSITKKLYKGKPTHKYQKYQKMLKQSKRYQHLKRSKLLKVASRYDNFLKKVYFENYK